ELWHRRSQIVADAALVLQEFRGHDGADGMAAQILRPGAAAPVPVKAGDRVGAAWLQFPAQHIAIGHTGSISHPAASGNGLAGAYGSWTWGRWPPGRPGRPAHRPDPAPTATIVSRMCRILGGVCALAVAVSPEFC